MRVGRRETTCDERKMNESDAEVADIWKSGDGYLKKG